MSKIIFDYFFKYFCPKILFIYFYIYYFKKYLTHFLHKETLPKKEKRCVSTVEVPLLYRMGNNIGLVATSGSSNSQQSQNKWTKRYSKNYHMITKGLNLFIVLKQIFGSKNSKFWRKLWPTGSPWFFSNFAGLGGGKVSLHPSVVALGPFRIFFYVRPCK